MITVANRTETAARIKYAFEHKRILIDALCDPTRTLHIDTRVLKQAEEREEAIALDGERGEGKNWDADGDGDAKTKLTVEKRAELLRQQVDTIGQPGKPGADIQHVISVGMLSEGWDAKTVTHIMGLRAFTSQLLCEQVVGRGLRRTSYEVKTTLDPATGEKVERLEPEYVNIFGIPFTFLPHEEGEGPVPPPPSPKTKVEPVIEKQQYAISFPNIIRIEHGYRERLTLDMTDLQPLELDASQVVTEAELAAILEGKPNLASLSQIELERLGQELRLQHIIFRTAASVYDSMHPEWKGAREHLLAQIVALVERFVRSDYIVFKPPFFSQDDLRRRVLLTLNMNKVVQHIWGAIRAQNTETLEPVFDDAHPIRSTGDMRPWYTGRPCERTQRSHINFCVYDSAWEASEAYQLDNHPAVTAWVRNDHLGFEIPYIYKGVRRKYRPDFLVRLTSGGMLVLEVKGRNTEEDRVKQEFLAEWVRAVNAHGGFWEWCWDVLHEPKDIVEILGRV
jgi:type III restriction enzyme